METNQIILIILVSVIFLLLSGFIYHIFIKKKEMKEYLFIGGGLFNLFSSSSPKDEKFDTSIGKSGFFNKDKTDYKKEKELLLEDFCLDNPDDYKCQSNDTSNTIKEGEPSEYESEKSGIPEEYERDELSEMEFNELEELSELNKLENKNTTLNPESKKRFKNLKAKYRNYKINLQNYLDCKKKASKNLNCKLFL